MPPSPRPAWTTVLFDLDGTILDSAPGIMRSLRTTFATMGMTVPPDSELIHYVGPPLMDSLRHRAGLDETTARTVLEAYRRDYRQAGVTDAALFPGVIGLLGSLRTSGVSIALATSKPETQARRALGHFDLSQFFDVIAGATEDETRSSKSAIVAHALFELRERGADVSRAIMVGDRVFDVQGAAANGLPTVIVEWGYGTPEESVDAIATVVTAEQLRDLLIG